MIKLSDRRSLIEFLPAANHPKQQRAVDWLKKTDFPNSKNEEWKYSDPKEIVLAQYQLAGGSLAVFAKPNDFWDDGFFKLFVLDGQFVESLSDKIEGVEVLSMKTVFDNQLAHSEFVDTLAPTKEYTAFDAMNLAFFQDGVFIEVKPKTQIDKPIVIVCHNTSRGSALLQTRNFIKVRESAKACFVEYAYFEDSNGSFLNQVTELLVEENAHVELLNWQDLRANNHVNSTRAHVFANARLVHSSLTFSGSFVRNNLNIKILGENSEVLMNGLYRIGQKDFVDNHTAIDHTVPRSYSEQLYKGILDQQAKAVFNGKIFVRPDAQKTNAYQSNKNILLNPAACVYTKPQLEIWANDVKCSHGSTVGAMDEEPMFYLRSRGLTFEQARTLLLSAYMADVLGKIENRTLREKISVSL